MIAALLYAAWLWAAYSPINKPFQVKWEIRWHLPYLPPTQHARRFRTAEEAVRFQMSARLCSSNPVPCVTWAVASPVPIPPYATVRR